jgi:hypothetical protein
VTLKTGISALGVESIASEEQWRGVTALSLTAKVRVPPRVLLGQPKATQRHQREPARPACCPRSTMMPLIIERSYVPARRTAAAVVAPMRWLRVSPAGLRGLVRHHGNASG